MLVPKATLSTMMDDYLKFRSLHQGSPAGIEQCERTYLSLLSSLRHNAPRALTRDAVEWWLMAELERGISARTKIPPARSFDMAACLTCVPRG